MPIQTLLLTGANNHDWRRTAPFLRDLLQNHNFDVTLSEDPSSALAGDLSGVELFVLDYNGPLWEEAARENFLARVREGAGVCVVHAANNAFEGWAAYEKMVGLLWREGTGHGAYHEFEVRVTDREHPITRGLGDFKITDELYHRLANPQNVPMQVLASAFSSPESGGTGADEPMLMVLSYGTGRVFHTALGHVWEGTSMAAVENAGFQATLLRGCEWAATGDVAEHQGA